MDDQGGALHYFHPLVRAWFSTRYGVPTDAQQRAWPLIASGRSVLITSPTGTGKTYAAFLFALNELIAGHWPGGTTRVLYVSPLKALNTDVGRNLLVPLDELAAFFRAQGKELPQIAVATRSGDTPQSERRRMARRPPEILITTPESLNLILASPRSREMLAGLKTVILDEVHAIVATKRGTHLITAVDRLVPIAGEFQRIALSATVKPLEETAAFVGGYTARYSGEEWIYERRPVDIVRSPARKEALLAVRSVGAEEEGQPQQGPRQDGETVWEQMSRSLLEIVAGRRSTLVFVNSRQLAERLAHLLNGGQSELIAYAHHGSLSRELRAVVEKRLKEGDLRAIVATSSLELGIDIGELDEVLLVDTPPTISQTVQRLGRAGHGVGEVARGVLFASNGPNLVRGVVAARLAEAQNIEEVHPIVCPLDVLAQVIVSMVGVEPWKLSDLYALLRTSFPFHALTQHQLDLVIEMLEGRYADSRVRELKARVSIDRQTGVIRGREGVLYLLYAGGGTIPDRGYFGLHVQGSDAKVGELDEEFVWERKVGDTFSLGTQHWKITGIDHQRVRVIPWSGPLNAAPFWRAEGLNRDFHFSEEVALALERWDGRIGKPGFAEELMRSYRIDEKGASRLESFLRAQAETTGRGLPHRHRILVEHTGARAGVRQIIIHTIWGGRVNHPFSLALSAHLRHVYGEHDVVADNDCIAITLPHEEATPGEEALDVAGLLREVAAVDVEELLREELEGSGFFGARFRENAGRALLLPRSRGRQRVPLWITRLRAKKLLDRVRRYSDFPIVAETWRSCVRDEMDLRSLEMLLLEIRTGAISVEECRTAAPSPFAASSMWLVTGGYMYADDAPAGASPGGTSLSSELLSEMVFSRELRIAFASELVRRFREKLQRTAPGYAPRSARELSDWLKERLAIPVEEWESLLAGMSRDWGLDPAFVREEVAPRTRQSAAGGGLVIPIDYAERVGRAVAGEAEAVEQVVPQWLQFYGPIPVSFVKRYFGAKEQLLEELLDALEEERSVVRDFLIEGDGDVAVCDAENLERLLLFRRREATPPFTARPLTELPLFLARWQGLGGREGSSEELKGRLEGLFGYPARAELWESEIFPARLAGYRRQWLDRLLAESELEWFGCGTQRLSFRLASDAELYETAETGQAGRESGRATGSPGEVSALFADPHARYSFWDLHARSGLATDRFTELLWREVWRGGLLCDSFEVVRRGAQAGFKVDPAALRALPLAAQATEAGAGNMGRGGRPSRRDFDRWKSTRPLMGTWYLPAERPERDILDEEESAKERVRLLLERYGLLFRELLSHELPGFRWPSLFRSMRLMELSGELLSGQFFEGIPGLQFISHAAFGLLQSGLAGDALFWVNALDPASLCGVDLPTKRELPSRLSSNRVVYRGKEVAVVSRKGGRELEIRVSPDDPALPACLAFLPALLSRDADLPKAIKVERVNGEPVRNSPYRHALTALGFQEDFKAYTLWAR